MKKEVERRMKICITATNNNLDAMVDPRFGRCKYFLIVNTDSNEFESISNESMMASGGAGIQAAQMVANKAVETVITGNIGPNAFETLTAADIKIITGATGPVKEVIDQFKKGELVEIQSPTVGSHFGVKAHINNGSRRGGI
jgi:predicted Fe-Mo cluster-binding NifX family protein